MIDEKKTFVGTRVTKPQSEAVKAAAKDRGVRVSDLIRRGLILAAPELEKVLRRDFQ